MSFFISIINNEDFESYGVMEKAAMDRKTWLHQQESKRAEHYSLLILLLLTRFYNISCSTTGL